MFLAPESIQYIAVHCSATSPNMNIGRKEIDTWHKELGWDEIGYHFVIRREVNSYGSFIELGRDINKVGAHVKGYNSISLGICLVGGIDTEYHPEDNYTLDQYENLYVLLRCLNLLYPKATIQGHRDFPNVQKDCPCFNVREWWFKKLSVINKDWF